jgi:Protein of unknown function (DUF3618)
MSDVRQARALRQEIEQTRAELGQTVEALAAKVDVRARARQAARDGTDRVRVQLGLAARSLRDSPGRTALLATALAGLIGLMVARMVRGRRA